MAESYKSSATQQRELRAQGRRTMRRLLDAGLEVFSVRGYHATRVDDIVRVARTSHGTFYLYFANKEDLLRALAVDCAQQLNDLAADIGPIDGGPAGFTELRRFLASFLAVYRRFGPVIRSWMERQVGDAEIDRLGTKAFAAVGAALGARMRADLPGSLATRRDTRLAHARSRRIEALATRRDTRLAHARSRRIESLATRRDTRLAHARSVEYEDVAVAALMAMIERFSYVVASHQVIADDDTMLDTLAHIVHRGFFGGS